MITIIYLLQILLFPSAFIYIVTYSILFFMFTIKKYRKFNDDFQPVNDIKFTTIIPLKNGNEIIFNNIKHSLNEQPNNLSNVYVVIEDETEPLYNQLKELEKSYKNFSLLLSGNEYSIGGKVHNMIKGYSVADCEYVVFMDADVKTNSKVYYSLYQSIIKNKSIGGFAPAFYEDAKTLSGKIIMIITNYFFTEALITFEKVIPFKFCSGAFMMFNKKELDKLGGLSKISDNISDDASLGKLISGAGYKVAYSDSPIFMKADDLQLAESIQHTFKWLVIVKYFTGIAYYLFPITFFIGNLFAVFIYNIISNNFIFFIEYFLILVVFLKLFFTIVQDYYLWNKFLRFINYPLMIILSILQPYVWFFSLFKKSLFWSGRKYKLIKNGKVKFE